ncbi:MAG: hypothetical protein HY568_00520 [Candidatus Latescibacteria bacterium]|nr:hypothetical protein [Candidatus Latescibacterota bacterium]
MHRSLAASALMSLLIAASLAGCARKAERLVGNARLLRGPAGLGTTVRLSPAPDRDTYVDPGTADFGDFLLTGSNGSLQASAFLGVSSWNLPDTTLAGFQAQSVTLRLTRDLRVGFDTTEVTLYVAASAWDTTTISWPGPGAGAALATADDSRGAGEFEIPLGAGGFNLVKQAVSSPASVPGFTIQVSLGQKLVAYKAGAAVFRIVYAHDVSGSAVFDSLDTPVTQDFTLRSPLAPTPTGADSSLVLGGLFKTSTPLHFPVDSIPAGTSIDEATLVLFLQPGSSEPDSADVIEVRRIRSGWAEGITDQSSLTLDVTPLTTRLTNLVYSSAERRIAIRIPGDLLREWAVSASTNDGVFVSLLLSNDPTKEVKIGSRESARPAELHVTYTDLPPGRF